MTEFDELWERLGDTPVNEDGELDCVFDGGDLGIYAIGTDRETIWHDIEEHFDISIGNTFNKKVKSKDFTN